MNKIFTTLGALMLTIATNAQQLAKMPKPKLVKANTPSVVYTGKLNSEGFGPHTVPFKAPVATEVDTTLEGQYYIEDQMYWSYIPGYISGRTYLLTPYSDTTVYNSVFGPGKWVYEGEDEEGNSKTITVEETATLNYPSSLYGCTYNNPTLSVYPHQIPSADGNILYNVTFTDYMYGYAVESYWPGQGFTPTNMYNGYWYPILMTNCEMMNADRSGLIDNVGNRYKVSSSAAGTRWCYGTDMTISQWGDGTLDTLINIIPISQGAVMWCDSVFVHCYGSEPTSIEQMFPATTDMKLTIYSVDVEIDPTTGKKMQWLRYDSVMAQATAKQTDCVVDGDGYTIKFAFKDKPAILGHHCFAELTGFNESGCHFGIYCDYWDTPTGGRTLWRKDNKFHSYGDMNIDMAFNAYYPDIHNLANTRIEEVGGDGGSLQMNYLYKNGQSEMSDTLIFYCNITTDFEGNAKLYDANGYEINVATDPMIADYKIISGPYTYEKGDIEYISLYSRLQINVKPNPTESKREQTVYLKSCGAQVPITIKQAGAPIPQTLQIALPQDTIEKGQSISLTISLENAPKIDLPIILEYPTDWLQCSTAVINAGNTSCQINVTAIDDRQCSAARKTSIKATAKNCQVGVAEIVIAEDFPDITFSLSSNEQQETDGLACITATITRTNKKDRPVTVSLKDDSSNDIIYSQTSFTMETGVETATVQLGIADNNFVEGDRDVVITAAIKLNNALYRPKTQTIHIIDNDVPTLSVVGTTNSLVEGKSPAGYITISRNTPTTEVLNVTVACNNDENLVYDRNVQIPVGETSITVPIAVNSDDVESNSREVKFTISAEGFVGAEYYAIVADNTFADAYIKAFNVNTNTITIGDDVVFSVEIGNRGVIALSKGIQIGIYSSDTYECVQSVSLTEPLRPGDSAVFSFAISLPTKVGKNTYYTAVNAEHVVRELFFDNNESQQVTIDVKAPYQVTSLTADKSICQIGDSVLISGAVEGVKISNMPVEIYMINEGYRTAVTISTNEQGYFSLLYGPAAGQSGRISIGACYPQTRSNAEMATVDYYSLNVKTRYLQSMLTQGESQQQSIPLYNPCGIALHNVRVEVPPTNEYQGDLKSVVIISEPLAELQGRQTASLHLQLKSDVLSSEQQYTVIPLRILSDEGTVNELPLYVYCRNKEGELILSVDKIETTMSFQKPHDYLLYFYNIGAGETGEISLSLPPWMSTLASNTIPSIASGDTAKILLRMTPAEDMQLNVMQKGMIGINPTNCQGMYLPFEVMLVSTDKGTLRVDVRDEYTYYTEQAPHVQSAQVLVKNPSTGAVVYQGLTNEKGIVETEIPEGYYTLSVSADNHDAYKATILIEPGKINNQIVNLSVRSIELSWTVEETEVEDKYEIVTTIKYETNVPAPVVVVDAPRSIAADQLNPGESLIYTVTITNQGLIRADDVTITLPAGGNELLFEALAYGEPFDLNAKQTVSMPVRVTRLEHPMAKAPQHPFIECTDNMITLYYWDCGTDRKWHKYGVPLIYDANCDGIPTIEPCQGDDCNDNVDPWSPIILHGGGGGGGFFYIKDTPLKKTEDIGCEPCQGQFLMRIADCALGFTAVGKSLDVISEILHCYNASALELNYDSRMNEVKECLLKSLSFFIPQPLQCIWDFLKPCDLTAENAADAPMHKAPSTANQEPKYITDFRSKATIAINEYDYFQNMLEAFLPSEMTENITMAEKADMITALQIYSNTLATKEDLLPFRPSAMTDIVFDLFVERVQNTYRVTHYQTTTSDNYVHQDEVLALLDSVMEQENLAKQWGYESTSQMLTESYDLFLQQLEQSSSSVCASVTLQFKQKQVMTRQAFKGTLTVLNGHETEAMTNAHLNLTIYNEQGKLATDHEFEVHVETLSGFVGQLTFDSEQGWQLPANTTGIATIMFIPTRYAAPTQEQKYSFGGTFSYVDPFSGLEVTRDLFPVTMTVKPSPILNMTYFVQRDVIADDPLTTAVEPVEPAEFALLISNEGYGNATNVQMVTEAPKIVDNEKGLLIDFALLYARLNGKDTYLPMDSSVATDFGTIPAQSQAYAQWFFTGSLLGHFTEYSIEATHLTSFDNPDLSLLNQVTVHEMIHTIQVPSAASSTAIGWLVNDKEDIQDMPDCLYTSTADTLPLYAATHVETQAIKSQTYRLTITPSNEGWNYGNTLDPTKGKQKLVSVIRESDNQEISLKNVWITSVTIQDRLDPVHEYRIHITDQMAGETSYILNFSAQEQIDQFTISVVAENGSVTGAGTYDYGTEVTLTATPNEHYHFVQWSDGLTTASRTITVESDATYTALFAIDQFTIDVVAENGSVTGAGTYDYGTEVTLTATPNEGYEFDNWSNGVTDNPYTFIVEQDVELIANFIKKFCTSWQDVNSEIKVIKYVENERLIIERNGVKYTSTGQKVQ